MRRAVQCSVEVVEGYDALIRGMMIAKCLFNYLRYLNRKRREEEPDAKYPGAFGWQKIVKDDWSYRNLSDRCSSYTVKDFDIGMKSFFSNLKQNPHARPPRYCESRRTLTFEVGRNAKPVGDFEYRLTVLGGHIKKRHATIRLHVRPGVKMENVKLIRVKPTKKRGRHEASIILVLDDVPVVTEGQFAAIDLGVINLGALAFDDGDTILYNGRGLLDVMRYGSKRAAKCKPSGWKPGGQRLRPSQTYKRYLKKSANISKLAIHNFTTDVIRQCAQRGVGLLAVGKLTGIREGKNFGKAGNQKFHRWPHLEIRRQLKYKGEEVGIEVIEISEAYTSQTCCRCGTIRKSSRVTRGLYACKTCGLQINADINGAFNMLKKVSPEAQAKGVEAALPRLPSPVVVRDTVSDKTAQQGTGEMTFANHPVFTAEYDLRNWAIVATRRLVS